MLETAHSTSQGDFSDQLATMWLDKILWLSHTDHTDNDSSWYECLFHDWTNETFPMHVFSSVSVLTYPTDHRDLSYSEMLSSVDYFIVFLVFDLQVYPGFQHMHQFYFAVTIFLFRKLYYGVCVEASKLDSSKLD